MIKENVDRFNYIKFKNFYLIKNFIRMRKVNCIKYD